MRINARKLFVDKRLSTNYKVYGASIHSFADPAKGEILNNHFQQKSLVEFIIQDLEEKINKGTLKQGERVVEETLCKTFGVSRSPVREAIRILESQGYVDREPRKGVSVSKVTVKDIEDTYRIRANLESLAVYLSVKKQNPKILQKLKKIHSKMIKLEKDGKVSATYFNLNLKFHKTLVDACENKRLIQMIDMFVKQTRRYRLKVLSIPGRLKASLENHQMIISSFEAGDAEKAESLRKNTILKNINTFYEKKEG